MEAHTQNQLISHQLELRSIKRAGRPPDTFADPVNRLRAWNWLQRVVKIADVDGAIALDKHPLTHEMLAIRCFQAIDDDGFDPANMKATEDQSLLDFVTDKKAYREAKKDYYHPLWLALQDRQFRLPDQFAFIDKTFRSAGVAAITFGDAGRADRLGLEWPEFERKWQPYLGPGECPCLEPKISPLSQVCEAESFASLDGLLALLLLYRDSLDRAALDFAGGLGEMLERASYVFAGRLRGEFRDTWIYVTKTRMTSWTPQFAPDEQSVSKAEQQIRDEFEETQKKGKKHGRERLHPSQVTKGKVARRWRRRVLMRACAQHVGSLAPYAGFQVLSSFNDWLISNRSVIDAHLDRAGYLLVLDEGTDPEYEATFENLPPLEVPVDEQHQINRPHVDPYEEYRFGGVPFDFIPIVQREVAK